MAVMDKGQEVEVMEHVQMALEVMGLEILQTVRIIIQPALGMVVSLAFGILMAAVGKTLVLKVVVDIMVVVALNRPDLLEVVVVIMEV